ncbi:hypothetical protein BKA56DRAFT_623309 [Ilyonectria sp. MPI-CAGE-AT-0026]|nr:hypothetical protein BKA56DRAFT_623309 [Ilyonectria sp. MPI-CAGE-AT-0026]
MYALFVLADVSPSNRNTLTAIEVTDSMKEAATCATSVAETSDANATASPCDDSVTRNCVNISIKCRSTNVATATTAPVYSERRDLHYLGRTAPSRNKALDIVELRACVPKSIYGSGLVEGHTTDIHNLQIPQDLILEPGNDETETEPGQEPDAEAEVEIKAKPGQESQANAETNANDSESTTASDDVSC